MTAAVRLLPDSTNGSPPYDALTWQQKANSEVIALWRFLGYPLINVSGTNAILATTDTTIVAAIASYQKGMKWSLIPANDITNAATINIDSIGVKSLTDADGNAFVGGELKAGRLYLIEYDGTVIRVIAGGSTGSASAFSPAPDLMLRDEKTTNTAGGTATSGAFAKRTLNTVIRNNISGASLALSQFTLPPGTYYCEWSAPAFYVTTHLTRLFNATDSTTVETGSSEYSSNAGTAFGGVTTRSVGCAYFTITTAKAFEIDHIVGATLATTGLGDPTNLGAKEVYTFVNVWKVPVAGAGTGGRIRLSANATYYVRPGGNDAHDGSADVDGSAWLTPQYAANYVLNNIDSAGFDVTVHFADGTSYPTVTITTALVGGGRLIFAGNAVTPTNVAIAGITASRAGTTIYVQNMQLKANAAGNSIDSNEDAHVYLLGGVDFPAVVGNHLNATRKGFISNLGSKTISGGGISHYNMATNGVIRDSGNTTTFNADATFSGGFVNALALGNIQIVSFVFNLNGHTCTGQKWLSSSNACINTGGGSQLTYFPGTVAGAFGSPPGIFI